MAFIEPVSLTELFIAILAISAVFAVTSHVLPSELHFDVFVIYPSLVQLFDSIAGLVNCVIVDMCESEAVFFLLEEDSGDVATF